MKAPSESSLSEVFLCRTGLSMRGEEGKGTSLANPSRYNLGFPLLPTPDQPLIKTSPRSGVDLPLLLPPHTPLPLFSNAVFLLIKTDFVSRYFLHWHRDRPQEAEKIIVITQIIASKHPRFLVIRDASSWTPHFQLSCPSIRIRHEASARV